MGTESFKPSRSRTVLTLEGLCVFIALCYFAIAAWDGGFLSSTPKDMGISEWVFMGAGAFMLMMVVWLEIRISEQRAIASDATQSRAFIYRKERSKWSSKRMRVKYYFRLEDRRKVKGRIEIDPKRLRFGADGGMTVFYDPKTPEQNRLDVSLWTLNFGPEPTGNAAAHSGLNDGELE